MKQIYQFYILGQAYNCGAYGQSGYSECATQTPVPSGGQSSNGQSQNGSSLQNTTSPGQADSNQQSDTNATNPQTTTSDSNGTVQTSPELSVKETGPLAGIGFEWILIGAVLLALIIAWFIMLFKRRRKRPDTNQVTFGDFPPKPPANPPNSPGSL